MSFADSIKTCFTKYFDGKGRASRSEYWWFYLLGVIIYLVEMQTKSSLLALLQLSLVIPNVTAGIRRMHDVDISGWFLLIPIYNIVLLATEGTLGPNRFGNNLNDSYPMVPPNI